MKRFVRISFCTLWEKHRIDFYLFFFHFDMGTLQNAALKLLGSFKRENSKLKVLCYFSFKYHSFSL